MSICEAKLSGEEMSGRQIRFDNPTAGYEHDRIRNAKCLTEGEIYLIDRVVVHGWHTDVYIKGFKEPFNSVCFTLVD